MKTPHPGSGTHLRLSLLPGGGDNPPPPTPGTLDVRALVAAFEVDQPSWGCASAEQAADAAELLHRVARLTGDVEAADLAAIWSLRAAEPAGSRGAHRLAEAYRSLQVFRRSADRRALRRAVRLARSLPHVPETRRTEPPRTGRRLALVRA